MVCRYYCTDSYLKFIVLIFFLITKWQKEDNYRVALHNTSTKRFSVSSARCLLTYDVEMDDQITWYGIHCRPFPSSIVFSYECFCKIVNTKSRCTFAENVPVNRSRAQFSFLSYNALRIISLPLWYKFRYLNEVRLQAETCVIT